MTCPRCHGSGLCPVCGGDYERGKEPTVYCTECNEGICPRCKGTGQIEQPKPIPVFFTRR